MSTIKKIFVRGCVINTVLTTGFYLLAAFIAGFDWIPSLGTMFILLGISFVVSAAEQILACGFSMAARIILNYALCAGGFLVLFILGNKNGGKASQVLIAAVFFTFAYILVNTARFIALSRKARRENEKEEYTPAFKR